MYKAVLCDMDGTLVDSERYYCDGTYHWLKRYGYKGSIEPIYEIIGTTMQETYEIIYRLLEGRLSLDEIKEINTQYFYSEDRIDYKKYLFKEVPAVLKRLKKEGYKLALCSASSYADILRFIEDCDFKDIFDVILSSDDTLAKPHPDIYIKAMTQLQLDSKEVLIIEDSPYGIRAAKATGALTLARTSGYLDGKQEEADDKIKSLDEIFKYIGEKTYAR